MGGSRGISGLSVAVAVAVEPGEPQSHPMRSGERHYHGYQQHPGGIYMGTVRPKSKQGNTTIT